MVRKLSQPMLITCGDPCGIGAEVIHGALARSKVNQWRDIFVIGHLQAYARALGDHSALHRYHIVPFSDMVGDSQAIISEFERNHKGARRPYFLDLGGDADGLEMGTGCLLSGEYAVEAFEAALDMLAADIGGVLVTAPLSKRWAMEAGFSWPGHTEALAATFQTDAQMVMVGAGMKVALATVHEPISSLSRLLDSTCVEWAIHTFHDSLALDFGIAHPRIAVCGLNPHAGEDGVLGDEEERCIIPAIEAAQAAGLEVSGPHPADSVFVRERRGEFDGVLAMYHDQGLIPVKLLAFDSGVNFSAGLPIVRVSPDHGTAWDIAGKGIADAGAMRAAIALGDAIARRRSGRTVSPTVAERKPAPSRSGTSSGLPLLAKDRR